MGGAVGGGGVAFRLPAAVCLAAHFLRTSAITRLPDRYEDGDGEDITPEELDEILVDKEGVKQRRRDLLAAFATGAAGTPAGRENDENEGGPFGSGKWPGGRPAAGALGDATQRTRNMSLPGQERRSK